MLGNSKQIYVIGSEKGNGVRGGKEITVKQQAASGKFNNLNEIDAVLNKDLDTESLFSLDQVTPIGTSTDSHNDYKGNSDCFELHSNETLSNTNQTPLFINTERPAHAFHNIVDHKNKPENSLATEKKYSSNRYLDDAYENGKYKESDINLENSPMQDINDSIAENNKDNEYSVANDEEINEDNLPSHKFNELSNGTRNTFSISDKNKAGNVNNYENNYYSGKIENGSKSSYNLNDHPAKQQKKDDGNELISEIVEDKQNKNGLFMSSNNYSNQSVEDIVSSKQTQHHLLSSQSLNDLVYNINDFYHNLDVLPLDHPTARDSPYLVDPVTTKHNKFNLHSGLPHPLSHHFQPSYF